MEFVGEVCADFLGLNDSQYQWIIDEHRRREAEVWQLRLFATNGSDSQSLHVVYGTAAPKAAATEGAQGSEGSAGGGRYGGGGFGKHG